MPEDPPKEDPPKEDPPKQDPPKEDPPKQDPPKDDTDWKAESRKWEERAKANKTAADELEELKKKGMSEQERAVDEAKNAGRAEEREKAGARVVTLAVKAAAAERRVKVDGLLKRIDHKQFLTEDGEPDDKAIAELLDDVAPAKGGRQDLGQGARGGGGTTDMNDLLFGGSRSR